MSTFDAGEVTLHLQNSADGWIDVRHAAIGDFHVVVYATYADDCEHANPFAYGMANGSLSLNRDSPQWYFGRLDNGDKDISPDMAEFAVHVRTSIDAAHPDFVTAMSYALDKVKSFIDTPEEYSWVDLFSGGTSLSYAGFDPTSMGEVMEAVATWAAYGVPLWLTEGHGLEQVAGQVWEFFRNMGWGDSPYAVPVCNIALRNSPKEYAVCDDANADFAWIPDIDALENMRHDLACCRSYAEKHGVAARYADTALEQYNMWLRGDVFDIIVEVHDEWGESVTADVPGVRELCTGGYLGEQYADAHVRQVFAEACALVRQHYNWQVRTGCGAQTELEV